MRKDELLVSSFVLSFPTIAMPMPSSNELVCIPNFFSFTPFRWQGVNPHHSPTIKTTKEWVLSHGSLDEVKQRKIDDAKCELFGAASYPYVDLDMLYILNDSVVIVLLLDEITDELDYEGVLAVKETTMNAMTGKTPNDRCLVANFMRELVQWCFNNAIDDKMLIKK